MSTHIGDHTDDNGFVHRHYRRDDGTIITAIQTGDGRWHRADLPWSRTWDTAGDAIAAMR